MKKIINKDGFTLIEVLIATAILTITLLWLLSMLTTSETGSIEGRRVSEATDLAQQQLDMLESEPLSNISSMTSTDIASNTNINSFGNKTTIINGVTLPNPYTRFWNISTNTNGSKNVSVYVTWQYMNINHTIVLKSTRS